SEAPLGNGGTHLAAVRKPGHVPLHVGGELRYLNQPIVVCIAMVQSADKCRCKDAMTEFLHFQGVFACCCCCQNRTAGRLVQAADPCLGGTLIDAGAFIPSDKGA